MEPNILLVGRSMNSLEILRDELIKFDRKIMLANSEEAITTQLNQEKVDMVIIGAGLPDDIIKSMNETIKKTNSDLPIHIMEKAPGMVPASMIGYTNEKAVMWKLMGYGKIKGK